MYVWLMPGDFSLAVGDLDWSGLVAWEARSVLTPPSVLKLLTALALN